MMTDNSYHEPVLLPLDEIDRKILVELQASGRLTMKALAERIGLSSPAMIERVRHLEERGVITGYRAVVSAAALGRTMTVFITAAVQVPSLKAFLDQVQSEPAIVECHRTTGVSPYLMKAQVESAAALETLLDRLETTGAACAAEMVLSSPVPWNGVAAVTGARSSKTRAVRRLRRTGAS